MAVTHHLATGRLAGVLALACFLSDTAFAVDLSVAKEPLEYECKEVRSIWLTEASLGDVKAVDGKVDAAGDKHRYVIRRYETLRKMAAPILKEVARGNDNFFKLGKEKYEIWTAWQGCSNQKGNAGLRGGQIDFCMTEYYMKDFTHGEYVMGNNHYCQNAIIQNKDDFGNWRNDYSAMTCGRETRMDTDKLLLLTSYIDYGANAVVAQHQKCIRLDR